VLEAVVNLELFGLVVTRLPRPEHAVNEGVVEEEDGVEGCCVVLGHVAVSPGNGAGVLSRDLDAADCQVHFIMGRFDRDDGLGAIIDIVVPSLS
jgi:hypothetical protein